MVAREREHVGEVLSELARPRETPLGHTSGDTGLRVVTTACCVVACVQNVVLAVVKALCPILSKNRWVRGRCGRDNTGVRDASQVAPLGRVEAT